MNQIPVITLDGPSGSGKGTIARVIAERFGFHLLDSGALYRILGYAVTLHGVDLEDPAAIQRLAQGLDIVFDGNGPDTVTLQGEDISLAIRTDEASVMASRVGAIDSAREALFQRQLAFRVAPGLVADGRDMGTVVFPDAQVKIFLTASVQERAERRYKQLIGKGIGAMLPALLRDLKERDERDTNRATSPLRPASDAHILDTTGLGVEETMARVWSILDSSATFKRLLTASPE